MNNEPGVRMEKPPEPKPRPPEIQVVAQRAQSSLTVFSLEIPDGTLYIIRLDKSVTVTLAPKVFPSMKEAVDALR